MAYRENLIGRFTKQSQIKGFRHRGGWDVRWYDGPGGVTGFGVRVYPSGKNSYVFSFRVKGQKHLMVLGGCAAMTLDQAKKRAKVASVQVDDGMDPSAERRKLAHGGTFADLEREYMENHAKRHKKTWQTDESRLVRHIPASWRLRVVETIGRRDISTLHRKIGETKPYEANRTLDLLRVMFTYARRNDFMPTNADNPAEGIQKFKEEKRKRFVREAELPYLAAAIDHESDIYVRALIWLYMLTGARKAELLTRRRTDVDWKTGQLRLEITKSGEEQYLTLSGPAMAILQSLPAQEKNPYLFCGKKSRQHLVNIDKPWRRVRDRATVAYWADQKDDKALRALVRIIQKNSATPSIAEVRKAAAKEGIELSAGMTDIRVHDLRRTAGSWMSQASVDLNVIKEGLRHANISTTLSYARLGQDPAREAFEEHGQRVMAAAERAGPLLVVDGGASD